MSCAQLQEYINTLQRERRATIDKEERAWLLRDIENLYAQLDRQETGEGY